MKFISDNKVNYVIVHLILKMNHVAFHLQGQGKELHYITIYGTKSFAIHFNNFILFHIEIDIYH